MYTKEQLAAATLRQIGLVPADATPSPADSQTVKEVYDAKLEEWRDRKMVYWPNTADDVAEIPAPVFQPLCDLLENCIGNRFGRSSTIEERNAREELLLRPLRRHVSRPATGLPVRMDSI